MKMLKYYFISFLILNHFNIISDKCNVSFTINSLQITDNEDQCKYFEYNAETVGEKFHTVINLEKIINKYNNDLKEKKSFKVKSAEDLILITKDIKTELEGNTLKIEFPNICGCKLVNLEFLTKNVIDYIKNLKITSIEFKYYEGGNEKEISFKLDKDFNSCVKLETKYYIGEYFPMNVLQSLYKEEIYEKIINKCKLSEVGRAIEKYLCLKKKFNHRDKRIKTLDNNSGYYDYKNIINGTLDKGIQLVLEFKHEINIKIDYKSPDGFEFRNKTYADNRFKLKEDEFGDSHTEFPTNITIIYNKNSEIKNKIKESLHNIYNEYDILYEDVKNCNNIVLPEGKTFENLLDGDTITVNLKGTSEALKTYVVSLGLYKDGQYSDKLSFNGWDKTDNLLILKPGDLKGSEEEIKNNIKSRIKSDTNDELKSIIADKIMEFIKTEGNKIKDSSWVTFEYNENGLSKYIVENTDKDDTVTDNNDNNETNDTKNKFDKLGMPKSVSCCAKCCNCKSCKK